jgi:hypothetical protein
MCASLWAYPLHLMLLWILEREAQSVVASSSAYAFGTDEDVLLSLGTNNF